jgi:hypothetical protein
MFSDATLSDINIVLCYVLSQYRQESYLYMGQQIRSFNGHDLTTV